MGEHVVQAVGEVGGISSMTLLVIAALVTVITILGEVIKSFIHRKANPLNGTLGELNGSIAELNIALTKIEMRTSDSDRVLEGHTEKLVIMSTAMAQLAVNETRQTEALLGLQPAIEKSITGSSQRIIEQSKVDSGIILKAIRKQT